MPDWQELAPPATEGLALESEESAQIVEELADHLEDQYRALLCDGISEKVAIDCVREKIGDWRALKSQIESSREKERPMNSRVSQFWLPHS